MKKRMLILIVICISILTACQREDSDVIQIETGNDNQTDFPAEITEELENSTKNVQESIAPTKEQVLAARETALNGMTTEQIKRLKENIKVAKYPNGAGIFI